MRLSDADIASLRAEFAGGGVSRQELADRHGISRAYVGRLVAGDRRVTVDPVAGEVTLAVESFLDGLELDPVGRVRAASARALALKVDSAAANTTGTAALALPRLVATLDQIVAGLSGSVDVDVAAFARQMLSPLGYG